MGTASFFTIMLTALAIENVVFSRALGINKWILDTESPSSALRYGLTYTWMALFAGLGSYGVGRLMERFHLTRFLIAPAFFLLVILSFLITYQLIRRLFKKSAEEITNFLPIVAFNTALFGVLYLIIENGLSLSGTIAYSLGSGIGYTLALLLLMGVRRRVSLSPVPRSFRGVPIQLLYIGILSLALYGLLGYGLPT